MTLTDWHSHIWSPEHLGAEFTAAIDGHYTHKPSRGGTPDAHREAMARAGVDECVIIALTSDHLGMSIPNEAVADYARTWNGKAVAVASVDPTRASAAAELREAHDMGMRGVKLAPPYQNFHPHSAEAYSVYEVAASLGMFVIFHQGGVSVRRGVLEVAQPVLLDRVARDFPDMTMIIAHMGQPWHHEVVPLMRKHPRVYADLSARCSRTSQLRRILRDLNDYDLIPKVLWGSDFPTFDPAVHARQLLQAADPSDEGLPDLEQLKEVLSRPLASVPGVLS